MGITQEIGGEAQRLIQRHEKYSKDLADEFVRRNRRTGGSDPYVVQRPGYWEIAAGFNPYLVRANCEGIGRSIRHSIRNLEYHPRNAIQYQVPKSDGTSRGVSVFQVADSAVSRIVFHSLLEKNRQRLSAYSFAYRADLTVHDAIQHISSDIRGKPRIFVAEYDFSKYFDSIRHEHIWQTLDEQGFLFTEVERQVMGAFLGCPTIVQSDYVELGAQRRVVGVPQGTSVSLFLANVAAWPLDRALERLGVGFARYADDTLIWSTDYARLCEAVDSVNEIAKSIGSELNLRKSSGISILAPEGAPAEFKSKSSVEFVGYSFSSRGISIRESSVVRIKRHIAHLIFVNLLEAPMNGSVDPARFAPFVDRDYVVLIRQLRRYLYGDLTEEKLRQYRRRVVPRIRYKGIMAFYPVIDRLDELKALDGWLLHTISTSVRKRTAILNGFGHTDLPIPHGLSESDLLTLRGRTTDGQALDLQIPSFVRISAMLRRAALTHGPNAIGNPKSNNYYPDI